MNHVDNEAKEDLSKDD